MGVEKAPIEKQFPLGRQIPVSDRPGKNEDVRFLDLDVEELDKFVLPRVGTLVIVATLQASQTSALDVKFGERDHLAFRGKRASKPLDHLPEIGLGVTRIRKDKGLPPIGVRPVDRIPRVIAELASPQRLEGPRGGSLFLNGFKEVPAEVEQPSPLHSLEKIRTSRPEKSQRTSSQDRHRWHSCSCGPCDRRNG